RKHAHRGAAGPGFFARGIDASCYREKTFAWSSILMTAHTILTKIMANFRIGQTDILDIQERFISLKTVFSN
ncbi:MAG: hypothetical protein ACOVS5_13480, partial [Oligoflexus sp.]